VLEGILSRLHLKVGTKIEDVFLPRGNEGHGEVEIRHIRLGTVVIETHLRLPGFRSLEQL
jgi:hypothetical protein